MHNFFFQTTKETTSNQYWNKKLAKSVFTYFIWDTRAQTWKNLPEDFKLECISILAILNQTLFFGSFGVIP